MYRDPADADLEIHCRGYGWKVHRCVVRQQCAFVRNATSDRWQKPPGTIKGSAAGLPSIELAGDGDYPVLIRGMLAHFYGLPPGFEKWEDGKETTVDFRVGEASRSPEENSVVGNDISGKNDGVVDERHSNAQLEVVHQEIGDGIHKTTQSTGNERSDDNETDEASEDDQADESYDPQLEEPINYHVHMYALAEKYDIPSLRRAACEKFEDCFESSMLKPGFFDNTIWFVFNTTHVNSRDLRETTMKLLSKHKDAVFDGEGFTKRDDTWTTEFTTSLIRALVHGSRADSFRDPAIFGQKKKYKCPKCRTAFMGWTLSTTYLSHCPIANCFFECAVQEWHNYMLK